MTVTSGTYLPRDSRQPRGSRPWCAACDTDQYLLEDSVTVMNLKQETLAAAISCTNCGTSHVVATTAAFLATIPVRKRDRSAGAHGEDDYRHCQEAMAAGPRSS